MTLLKEIHGFPLGSAWVYLQNCMDLPKGMPVVTEGHAQLALPKDMHAWIALREYIGLPKGMHGFT